MSEVIEATVVVSKVTDVHADERTITVVLKGAKTVTHVENRYETEDLVDIEVKLKFRQMATAKVLRVDVVGFAKLLELSARDNLLSGYTAKVETLEV